MIKGIDWAIHRLLSAKRYNIEYNGIRYVYELQHMGQLNQR